MDIRELFESTKETISENVDATKERVQDFIEENKKMALIICGLVFFILICLILLIIIAAGGQKDSKSKNVLPPVEIVTGTENQLIPDGPKLPKDYNISRQPKDKWNKDEAEEWFTVPEQSEIDSLSFANERIVNEIIGAAP